MEKVQNSYAVGDSRTSFTGAVQGQDALDAAKTEVELAEARFSERVRRVSDLGNQLAERAWSEAKPLLLVTAAVATVATVAIGFALVRGGRGHQPITRAGTAKPRSLFATLALGIATHVARNLAERVALGVLANARRRHQSRL